METKHKQHYEVPSTTVFEVVQAGVICQSDVEVNGSPTYNRFSEEEVW